MENEREHYFEFDRSFALEIFAFVSIIAPALAAAPTPQPLNIAKECSQNNGKPGAFCTITKSSLGAIPVGTKIFYYGPVMGPPILSSDVVLGAGEGNTAIGYCNVELAKAAGTSTFWAGSGTLSGFQAILTLSIDSTGLYHWDGSYTLAAK